MVFQFEDLQILGVSQNRATPTWMVHKGKSHLEMDDLGVPPFQETSTWQSGDLFADQKKCVKFVQCTPISDLSQIFVYRKLYLLVSLCLYQLNYSFAASIKIYDMSEIHSLIYNSTRPHHFASLEIATTFATQLDRMKLPTKRFEVFRYTAYKSR